MTALHMRDGWSDEGVWAEMQVDHYRIDHIEFDSVLDIGANIGGFALRVLDHHPEVTTMWCYEPEPENYELLLANTAELPEVRCIPEALWSEAGPLLLVPNQGLSHVCVASGGHSCQADPGHGAQRVKAHATTLASVVQERTFDLLKVDIEGSEFAVLGTAALDVLATFKHLRMEIHDYFGDAHTTALLEHLSEVFTMTAYDFVPQRGGIWAGERTL